MRSTMINLSARAAREMGAHAAASSDGLETGGVLLGHDFGREIRVTVAGAPGPLAQREPKRFLRDLDHARCLADEAYLKDGSVWLGEWHTHPSGPSTPSDIDVATYQDLLNNDELGFDRIVSIVVTGPLSSHHPGLRAHGWLFDGLELHATPIDRQQVSWPRTELAPPDSQRLVDDSTPGTGAPDA